MPEHDDKPKPKAQVVPISLASREILAEAQAFSSWCWKFLGRPPKKGSNGSDLLNIAVHLDLKPVAFAFLGPLNHWNLVTLGDRGRSRVYEPQFGLHTVENELITEIWLYDIFGKQQRPQNPVDLLMVNYEIPEYRLQGVGKTQIKPEDCGPLCVWAAKRALGK